MRRGGWEDGGGADAEAEDTLERDGIVGFLDFRFALVSGEVFVEFLLLRIFGDVLEDGILGDPVWRSV
jgi:hypothetical protein